MDLISKVIQKTKKLITNEKLEWELALSPSWNNLEINPFSYQTFKIKGIFIDPLNSKKEVFAFYFQDYKLKIIKVYDEKKKRYFEIEEEEKYKEGTYLLRYLTKVVGKHQLLIDVYLNEEIVQSFKKEFIVLKGDNKKGYLAVDLVNKRNFLSDNKETFIPIGHNLAWYASPKKTEDYQVWFKKLHKSGANFARIWLGPRTFSLDSGKDIRNFEDRMLNGKRLDKVFDFASKYNIYFMLTLNQHGRFSEKINPAWKYNSWSSLNGGILNSPEEFFTLELAKEIYKEQLIYLISRWGYAVELAAWEFWNEVNWTDNFSDQNVNQWHAEMAKFVKDNDPYNHLVTTSYKHLYGSGYHLDDIDYANPHSYDYFKGNVSNTLLTNISKLHNLYQKPILHSEIGINWRSGYKTFKSDPLGISFKQGLWGGALGGGAGCAMSWWWDSFIHPNDLYKHYVGISKFLNRVDLSSTVYKLLSDLKVKSSNKEIKVMGYYLDDRVYGYLYNNKWTYKNPLVNSKVVNIKIPELKGKYLLELFNTKTGNVIRKEEIESINDVINFRVNVKEDRAFILKRKI